MYVLEYQLNKKDIIKWLKMISLKHEILFDEYFSCSKVKFIIVYCSKL